MMEKLNFEEVADEFSKIFKKPSISRCDYVLIKDKEILFVEITEYEAKNLFHYQKYSNEIIENVKKMWGSLTVLTWYLSENKYLNEMKDKKKVYLLLLKRFDNKYSRVISNMLKTLQKYKNGGFDEIAFKKL